MSGSTADRGDGSGKGNAVGGEEETMTDDRGDEISSGAVKSETRRQDTVY